MFPETLRPEKPVARQGNGASVRRTRGGPGARPARSADLVAPQKTGPTRLLPLVQNRIRLTSLIALQFSEPEMTVTTATSGKEKLMSSNTIESRRRPSSPRPRQRRASATGPPRGHTLPSLVTSMESD
jgi:hypothetical protein